MVTRAVALLPWLAAALAGQYGTAPKAQPGDYPAHASLERLALGAEYLVHSFSGQNQTYIVRDYLVVEVALFPPKGQEFMVNAGHFALVVNGGKHPLSPQAPEFVAASLKYPDWEPHSHPQAEAGVGPVILGRPQPTERFPGDPQARPPQVPGPPRAPADNPSGVERQVPVKPEDLAVQTALPEGPARNPVSGYLYFAWQGKTKRIRSLELTYEGPAGRVSIPLI